MNCSKCWHKDLYTLSSPVATVGWLSTVAAEVTAYSTRAPDNTNPAQNMAQRMCAEGSLYLRATSLRVRLGLKPRVGWEGSGSGSGGRLRQTRPLQDSEEAFWKRPERALRFCECLGRGAQEGRGTGDAGSPGVVAGR